MGLLLAGAGLANPNDIMKFQKFQRLKKIGH